MPQRLKDVNSKDGHMRRITTSLDGKQGCTEEVPCTGYFILASLEQQEQSNLLLFVWVLLAGIELFQNGQRGKLSKDIISVPAQLYSQRKS